uniref:Uncharacterized protein n=1 Tax=Trichuris muris TaxID=70415 RepID=A0A5S6Q223_TRIMR
MAVDTSPDGRMEELAGPSAEWAVDRNDCTDDGPRICQVSTDLLTTIRRRGKDSSQGLRALRSKPKTERPKLEGNLANHPERQILLPRQSVLSDCHRAADFGRSMLRTRDGAIRLRASMLYRRIARPACAYRSQLKVGRQKGVQTFGPAESRRAARTLLTDVGAACPAV